MLIVNHTIPIMNPSFINSLSTLLKKRIEKMTTVIVSTTGIIDSNNGRLESFNGRTTKDTRNGINQIKIPKPIIHFTYFFIFST